MTDAPSHRLRSRWLEALLPRVPFEGWTDAAARAAAEEAGLSAGEQALAAPFGVADLVDAFFDAAEVDARASLEAADIENMRVRDRVAFGLRAWLDALAPQKEAVGKAAARGVLPWGAQAAARRTWSLADAIWTGAGDASEDYNRYTKRGLLAAVVPPVVLYWLREDDPAKVDAFIARRLDTAMRLGQAGGRALGPALNAVWGKRG